jgi:ribosomal protein S13
MQLHNMALVIAATTREMLEIKQLSLNNKTRLDAAREYLQGMNQRLKVVEHQAQVAEQRTRVGTLTEEQAREIQHRVNLLAQELTKHKPGEKHHMGVYEVLRQETGATSYKYIPMKGYETAIAFLDNWLNAIEGAGEQD